jgi:predicted dehydrogenase
MPSLKELNPFSKNKSFHVVSPQSKTSPRQDEPQVRELPPPRPPMSASPPRVLIIGAGSRGRAYSRAIVGSCNGLVAAVAEPIAYKRDLLGRNFIWGVGKPVEGQSFANWKEFVAWELKRRERAAEAEKAKEEGREVESVPEGIDAAFICVLDEMHRDVVIGLAPLGLHIMCEKPLACSLADCIDMYKAIRSGSGGTSNETNGHAANGSKPAQKTVFAIGHVLRYSPHNILLRKLLIEDRVIGDICSIEHTEPVGWWHFTHSYVRGNWRAEKTTAPSLLTKSCHDMDLLLWFLCSPPKPGPAAPPAHLPTSVFSTGALQTFKKSRKPAAAGEATNCFKCPLVDEGCKYSAKHIYLGPKLRGYDAFNTGWPISVVLPEIEDLRSQGDGPTGKSVAREALQAKLEEDYDTNTMSAEEIASKNWFGRCVFEADNDVCDDQTVTLTWTDDEPAAKPSNGNSHGSAKVAKQSRTAKRATLHMVSHSRKICERYSNIYGTDGEIYADSRTITIQDFNTGETRVITPRLEDAGGHGGGDVGLSRQFILAVDKVKNHGWEASRAQDEFMGCTLEEVLRSHAAVFAAEEARTAGPGGKVVDWNEWWEREVEANLD